MYIPPRVKTWVAARVQAENQDPRKPTACSARRLSSGEPHNTKPLYQRREDGSNHSLPHGGYPAPPVLCLRRLRTGPRQHTGLHPSNTGPTTMAAPTRRGHARSRSPPLDDHRHRAINNNGVKWHTRDHVQHALPRVLRPHPPGDWHLQARCVCG